MTAAPRGMPSLRTPRVPGALAVNVPHGASPSDPIDAPTPPPAVDWQTLRDAVIARRAAFAADDPRARVLLGAELKLTMQGGIYDAACTPATRIAAAAEAAHYDDEMAGWRATVGPLYALTDRVARELEAVQLAANTGLSLQPRVTARSDGRQSLLAPEVGAALAFPGGYDDEDDAPAALVLPTAGGSPTPVLRLVGLVPGREGNRLQARVDDVPGSASRFVLRVRLGGYEEAWKPLDTLSAWRPKTPDESSRLVAPLQQVGLGRPATVGWTTFAGGRGRVREALDARADAAVALPAPSEADRQLMDTALRAARDAWDYKPTPPAQRAGTATARVAAAVAGLADAMARAQAVLDRLDSLAASP